MKQCALALALAKAGMTDSGVPSRELAKQLADAGQLIGKSTINNHRAGKCVCAAPAAGKFSASGTDDQADSFTMTSEQAWGYEDFCNFIRSRGQDPDSVTFSWSVTTNPAGGYWNKLTNVKAKAVSLAEMVDYEELAQRVAGMEVRPAAGRTDPASSTYVVCLADLQLGKGENGGTAGTLERLNKSLSHILNDIQFLMAIGRLPRTLVLANLGDHIENVFSSYANQAYTVDMNTRDQIMLAIQVNFKWLQELAGYFDEVIYASTLCNHGQLSRNGGKTNVTDDADNATGLIGDALEMMCQMVDGLKHVQFLTPREEMITTLQVNGVSMAMAHGHKISGAEETWLAKQSQNLAHRRKFLVDIWLLAHKHHASLTDFGPYTRIQATTSDPGSKYFEDMTGQYSRPGVTCFILDAGIPGHWDHYNVF